MKALGASALGNKDCLVFTAFIYKLTINMKTDQLKKYEDCPQFQDANKNNLDLFITAGARMQTLSIKDNLIFLK